jgi:hypothetical protein
MDCHTIIDSGRQGYGRARSPLRAVIVLLCASVSLWQVRLCQTSSNQKVATPLTKVAAAQAALPRRLVRHSPKGDGGSLWQRRVKPKNQTGIRPIQTEKMKSNPDILSFALIPMSEFFHQPSTISHPPIKVNKAKRPRKKFAFFRGSFMGNHC